MRFDTYKLPTPNRVCSPATSVHELRNRRVEVAHGHSGPAGGNKGRGRVTFAYLCNFIRAAKEGEEEEDLCQEENSLGE